jgi:hypothetical protein
MTQVSLERAIVEDLVTSKLHVLQNYIDEILRHWNETSAKIFLEKARDGTYKNAEDDAVELRQLLLEYPKYQAILTHL